MQCGVVPLGSPPDVAPLYIKELANNYLDTIYIVIITFNCVVVLNLHKHSCILPSQKEVQGKRFHSYGCMAVGNLHLDSKLKKFITTIKNLLNLFYGCCKNALEKKTYIRLQNSIVNFYVYNFLSCHLNVHRKSQGKSVDRFPTAI